MNHRKNACRIAVALACLSVTTQVASAPNTTQLSTELVADGFFAPLLAVSPPNDPARLFVVQQDGFVYVVKNGEKLADPFLDITNRVAFVGERGLLGLVFDPDFGTNGYFYVNFVDDAQVTNVARLEVSGSNPDDADETTEFTIMKIPQPYGNHNGGMMMFGPNDGYLYIGMGDGGNRFDPENRAQDINELLGKMLRIDVRTDDFPNDPDQNYAIPDDNPFVGFDGRDEIWSLGVRNPWRWSFDSLTGDMFIADVGQGLIEELNFQSASSAGGENYGWRCMEGSLCTDLSGCTCDDPELTYPIHEYTHDDGCSITGGFVYRGESIPLLRGTYFFADYCRDTVWSLRYDGENVAEFMDRTAELEPPGALNLDRLTSFGQDAGGEVYLVDARDGEVFRIVAAMNLEATDLVAGQRAFFRTTGGDANSSVFFVYGTAGLGDVFVAALDVRLAVANPKLFAQTVTNASGAATVNRRVPSNVAGVTVWLQAAQQGNTTNVIRTTIL